MAKTRLILLTLPLLLLVFRPREGGGGEGVVVVMVSDVPPGREADYVTLTARMNWLWATRHGYRFRFIHQRRGTPCRHRLWGPRLKFWCRQLDFLSVLEEGEEYDWLLYLDSDAFIPNLDVTIEDILRLARSPAQSPLGDWFNASFRRGVEQPHVLLAKDVDGWPGVCMGVQVWRNSEISKQIMCDLFNSGLQETRTIYPDGRLEIRHGVQRKLFAEQGVMNQLLLEVLNGTRRMPNWEKHIAIGSARDLYLRGGLVFHAALGSSDDQGRRCGNDPASKLRRCIRPAWESTYKALWRDEEILIEERASYEEHLSRFCL